MSAAELGLDEADWECAVQLEGFLDQPFEIKEKIEKGSGGSICTGAQYKGRRASR